MREEEKPKGTPATHLAAVLGTVAGGAGLIAHAVFTFTLGAWRPGPDVLLVQKVSFLGAPVLGALAAGFGLWARDEGVGVSARIALGLGTTTLVVFGGWLALWLTFRVALPCLEGSPYCPFSTP